MGVKIASVLKEVISLQYGLRILKNKKSIHLELICEIASGLGQIYAGSL